MLKMVVSDLDGTLINGEDKLPVRVLEMIAFLKQKGILFTVASGRKVCELKKLFSSVKNDVIFIACDGAFVLRQDEVLFKEVIDKKIISKVFDKNSVECEKISDSYGDTVKIIAKEANVSQRMEEYIKNNRLLTCVYDDFGVKEYVKFGINKGTALEKVLKLFNIKKSETAVFGDNYNDKEMLKMIPCSYAMEGGKNEIKRMCRHITDDVSNTVMKLAEIGGDKDEI